MRGTHRPRYSGQVVTDVVAAVKELVANSLDAGALAVRCVVIYFN